jgi:hypothetical protein
VVGPVNLHTARSHPRLKRGYAGSLEEGLQQSCEGDGQTDGKLCWFFVHVTSLGGSRIWIWRAAGHYGCAG